MGTTLEKLLSIQAGKPEQNETAADSKFAASGREDAGRRVSPHPPPETQNRPISAPTSGIGEPPPGSIIRDVWGKAYRLYARCAPALRAADQEAAEALFLQAAEEAQTMGSMGEDGVIVGAAVLEMLDDVWKRARAG